MQAVDCLLQRACKRYRVCHMGCRHERRACTPTAFLLLPDQAICPPCYTPLLQHCMAALKQSTHC